MSHLLFGLLARDINRTLITNTFLILEPPWITGTTEGLQDKCNISFIFSCQHIATTINTCTTTNSGWLRICLQANYYPSGSHIITKSPLRRHPLRQLIIIKPLRRHSLRRLIIIIKPLRRDSLWRLIINDNYHVLAQLNGISQPGGTGTTHDHWISGHSRACGKLEWITEYTFALCVSSNDMSYYLYQI